MPIYTATQRYRSGRGSFEQGEQVDVSDEFADYINLDAPGTLELVVAEPEPDEDPEEGSEEESEQESEEDAEEKESEQPEQRQLDAPPADRMVKSARRRDRQGDPSDQGPITRDDHKAVKNQGD